MEFEVTTMLPIHTIAVKKKKDYLNCCLEWLLVVLGGCFCFLSVCVGSLHGHNLNFVSCDPTVARVYNEERVSNAP